MAKRKRKSIQEKVLDLVREQGFIRPKDLAKHKIARVHLSRLCEKQLLERVERGSRRTAKDAKHAKRNARCTFAFLAYFAVVKHLADYSNCSSLAAAFERT